MRFNVSSYRSDEFYQTFGNLNRDRLPGIKYQIDQLRSVPIIAYGILLCAGIPGNIWVACVIGCILGEKRTKAPKCIQIYIMALCCCDLIVLTFAIALLLDLITGEWLVESIFLCRLYLSSESLNKFAAPFLLVAMSFFCFIKVCQPKIFCIPSSDNIQHRRSSNVAIAYYDWVAGALYTVICCIFISFALLTPVYIYGDLHYIVYENFSTPIAVVTKCAFEPTEEILTPFTIYGFIFSYAFPASLFTSFHAAIWYRVRKQARERVGTGRRRGHGYLIRVTQTTLGLVVFYVVCWTPYWYMILYQALTPLDRHGAMTDTGVVLNYIAHMLPYVNCTGYPIIYTLLNRDIRQAYKRVMATRQSNTDRDIALRFVSGRRATRATIASDMTSSLL